MRKALIKKAENMFGQPPILESTVGDNISSIYKAISAWLGPLYKTKGSHIS